jgi:hypothetical protein
VTGSRLKTGSHAYFDPEAQGQRGSLLGRRFCWPRLEGAKASILASRCLHRGTDLVIAGGYESAKASAIA